LDISDSDTDLKEEKQEGSVGGEGECGDEVELLLVREIWRRITPNASSPRVLRRMSKFYLAHDTIYAYRAMLSSVRLSVTRVDQSKSAEVRIMHPEILTDSIATKQKLSLPKLKVAYFWRTLCNI